MDYLLSAVKTEREGVWLFLSKYFSVTHYLKLGHNSDNSAIY